MSDVDFVAGDVTELKSGGHKMTVDSLTKLNGDPASAGDAELVKVSWLTEHGDFRTASVKADMLKLTAKNEDKRKVQDEAGKGDEPKSANQRNMAGNGEGGFLDDGVAKHGMSRTISPFQQTHGDKQAIHTGDDRPQSLGNLAENQPAQEKEIQHTAATNDYENPTKTVKENDNKGKGLPSDDSVVTG